MVTVNPAGAMAGITLGAGTAAFGQGMRDREIQRRSMDSEDALNKGYASKLNFFMQRNPQVLQGHLSDLMNVDGSFKPQAPATATTPAPQDPGASMVTPAPTGGSAQGQWQAIVSGAQGGAQPAPAMGPVSAPATGTDPASKAGTVGPQDMVGGGMAALPSAAAPQNQVPAAGPSAMALPTGGTPTAPVTSQRPVAGPMVDNSKHPFATIFQNHLDNLTQIQGSIQKALDQIPAEKGSPEWDRAAAGIYKANEKDIEGWNGTINQDIQGAAMHRGQVVLTRALNMVHNGQSDQAAQLLSQNGVDGSLFQGAKFNQQGDLVLQNGTIMTMPEIFLQTGQLSPQAFAEMSSKFQQIAMRNQGYLAGQNVKANASMYGADRRMEGQTGAAQIRADAFQARTEMLPRLAAIRASAPVQKIIAENKDEATQVEKIADLMIQQNPNLSAADAHLAAFDTVHNAGKAQIAAQNNATKVATANPKKKGAMATPAAPGPVAPGPQ